VLTDADFTELRLLAESLFEDCIRVVRRVTPTSLDPVTGEYPDPVDLLIYHGPARIQVKADINSNVVEAVVAGREWTYLTAQLQLPVNEDTARIRPDDIAIHQGSRWDPSLEGREFVIHGIYHKTHATMRRFRLREVVG